MAKERVTLMMEKEYDRKIEVIAAVEGKTKSEVVDEALNSHIKSKDYLRDLPFQSNGSTPHHRNSRKRS